MDVIPNQEFLMLPADEVAKLLASDDLNVPSEEEIFHVSVNIFNDKNSVKRKVIMLWFEMKRNSFLEQCLNLAHQFLFTVCYLQHLIVHFYRLLFYHYDFNLFCWYFQALMMWLKNDITSRKKDVSRLLSLVKLPLLMPSVIIIIISRTLCGSWPFL